MCTVEAFHAGNMKLVFTVTLGAVVLGASLLPQLQLSVLGTTALLQQAIEVLTASTPLQLDRCLPAWMLLLLQSLTGPTLS
jgi:hypothetical protein